MQVQDSAIFEKGGCGCRCGGTWRLKNYYKYFYLYFLYIFTIKIFLKKKLKKKNLRYGGYNEGHKSGKLIKQHQTSSFQLKLEDSNLSKTVKVQSLGGNKKC